MVTWHLVLTNHSPENSCRPTKNPKLFSNLIVQSVLSTRGVYLILKQLNYEILAVLLSNIYFVKFFLRKSFLPLTNQFVNLVWPPQSAWASLMWRGDSGSWNIFRVGLEIFFPVWLKIFSEPSSYLCPGWTASVFILNFLDLNIFYSSLLREIFYIFCKKNPHIFYFSALFVKNISPQKNISKALCCALRDQQEKSISKSTPASSDQGQGHLL